MAGDKKRAAALKAWLVFIDETGLLMAPLLRRTWGRRGRTPVLRQRVRWRQKLSVIGALCLGPDRHRAHFTFRLHVNVNIRTGEVLDFLRVVCRRLAGPVVVLWDRFGPHQATRVRRFVEARSGLDMFFLPPYAPELNPVEDVWAYLKMNPLANWAPPDLDALARRARRSGRSVQRRPDLLRSFFRRSPLSFDLE